MAARLHSHFALSGLQDRPAQDSSGAGCDKRPHPDLFKLGTDAHEDTENNDANDELDDLTGSHVWRLVASSFISQTRVLSSRLSATSSKRPDTTPSTKRVNFTVTCALTRPTELNIVGAR